MRDYLAGLGSLCRKAAGAAFKALVAQRLRHVDLRHAREKLGTHAMAARVGWDHCRAQIEAIERVESKISQKRSIVGLPKHATLSDRAKRAARTVINQVSAEVLLYRRKSLAAKLGNALSDFELEDPAAAELALNIREIRSRIATLEQGAKQAASSGMQRISPHFAKMALGLGVAAFLWFGVSWSRAKIATRTGQSRSVVARSADTEQAGTSLRAGLLAYALGRIDDSRKTLEQSDSIDAPACLAAIERLQLSKSINRMPSKDKEAALKRIDQLEVEAVKRGSLLVQVNQARRALNRKRDGEMEAGARALKDLVRDGSAEAMICISQVRAVLASSADSSFDKARLMTQCQTMLMDCVIKTDHPQAWLLLASLYADERPPNHRLINLCLINAMRRGCIKAAELLGEHSDPIVSAISLNVALEWGSHHPEFPPAQLSQILRLRLKRQERLSASQLQDVQQGTREFLSMTPAGYIWSDGKDILPPLPLVERPVNKDIVAKARRLGFSEQDIIEAFEAARAAGLVGLEN